MHKIIITISLLALSACQQRSDNKVAAAVPSATPAPASAPLPTTIPASLHGRWGLVPADCTSTRGDAKGLLTIGASQLKFYESRGTVAKVIAAGPDRFDADYAFTGEGQEWRRIEQLELVADKLRRQTVTQTGEEPGVDLRYERCPA